MKNKKILLALGVIAVLLLIAITTAFFMSGNKEEQENTPEQDISVLPSSVILDLQSKLADPNLKEQMLYEFAYVNELSDTAKAEKIRNFKILLEQKAQAGNADAKNIMEALKLYNEEAETSLAAFNNLSCEKLIESRFNKTVAEVIQTPWESETVFQSLASQDHNKTFQAKRDAILFKKSLTQQQDESCQKIMALVVKKQAELSTNDPSITPQEVSVLAQKDLAGTNPYTAEKYTAEKEIKSPEAVFQNFDVKTNNLPIAPSKTLPVYQYKTDISYTDAEDIATLLGMKSRAKKKDANTYVVEDTSTALLTVSKTSGSFSYFSPAYWTQNNLKPAAISRSTAEKNVVNFLKKNNLLPDPYVGVETYTKKGRPTMFVEIHAGDAEVMPPKLHGVALLNNIGSVFGAPTVYPDKSSLPLDSTITNTSDKLDGYGRLNDFNTITAEVNANGDIIFLQYNMRLTKRTLPAVTLKTAEEALQDLQNGKGILDFVVPSEKNAADFSYDKVFPQNTAKAKNVRIEDVFLAYIQKPLFEQQEYVSPAYLFRGETQLENGYLVNYIVAVSAIKNLQ